MTRSSGRGRHVERCTFCEKMRHHVDSLIAGPPGVYICNECIEICNSILQEEQRRQPDGNLASAASKAEPSRQCSGDSETHEHGRQPPVALRYRLDQTEARDDDAVHHE